LTKLVRRTRLGYSLGSLVTGPFGTVPGLVMVSYLTDTVRVPAAWASVILIAGKVWDVLFNPVAGRLSDSGLLRTGSRRRSILIGGTGGALFFVAIFVRPDFSVPLNALYIGLTFAACGSVYALFQVSFTALPVELTDSPPERTKLTSARIGVQAIVILVSGVGAPAIINGIGGMSGYRAMSGVIAVIITTGTLSLYFALRSASIGPPSPSAASFTQMTQLLSSWGAFRSFLCISFIQAAGIGTLLAAVPFFAYRILGHQSYSGLLFATFSCPAFFAIFLWPRLSSRVGKVIGLRLATVTFAAGLASLAFAQVLPLFATLTLVALSGVGYSGVLVFTLSVLPDLIAAEEQRTGQTLAGLVTGVWASAESLGLALGGGLLAIIIAVGGYVPGATAAANQPHSAIVAILAGSSIVPGLLIALALLLMRKSVLKRSHEES
jgi:GPH family glycoside/pentoside/hexuronide:cation symporter